MKIHSALEAGRGALLKRRPLRTGIGPKLNPSGESRINKVSEEVQDFANAHYATRHGDFDHKMGIDGATSITEANRRFCAKWSQLESRMEVVPGKKFLSALNRELQNTLNTTVTPSVIAGAMRIDEVPKDMVALIQALESFRTT